MEAGGAATRDAERQRMVSAQIEARGITDPLVLQAMREVPRERFVAASMTDRAYDDGPLPIGHGQTISQPYIVAAMTAAAGLKPGTRVLEIGTGSGYGAAVLSRIAAEVYTVERVGALAGEATARLAQMGYANVHVRKGDGSLGWPEHAPYDAILVTASGPRAPKPLLEQLAVGGRLVMPVGASIAQRLVRVTRTEADEYHYHDLEAVAFVPLIGAEGWPAHGSEERSMPEPFVIGDETTHIKGDAQCPECLEEYPEPCPCGGLIHAAAGEQDEAGADWPLTRCDQCGRSEEELD